MKAKTRLTKLWSILLAVVLVISMIPTVALATESATADFYADPTAALTLLNTYKNAGAEDSTWDSSTRTLTLNGVNFVTTAATAVILPAESKIVLADGTTNTITGGNSTTEDTHGIKAKYSLSIQGTGTLNVTGGTAGDHSFGICTLDGDLVIRSGNVKAKGGEAKVSSNGLWAGKTFWEDPGNVAIVGGVVEAEGGRVTNTDGVSSGIYANKSIFIRNAGTIVTATGGTAQNYSFGIYAYAGNVRLYGGTLTAASKGTPCINGTVNVNDSGFKTISFESNNGGTGDMEARTTAETYTLPENGFTALLGKKFKGWSVDGTEKSVGDEITVTANTTITAVWEAVEYNVTVNGGTASVSQAAAGTTVTLTANTAPSGQVFDKWVAESGNVTLADATSATTTFTMPAGDVSVRATYHTHSYGSEWKSDSDKHWHECFCGDKSAEVAHTAGDWIIDTPATTTTDGTKHKACTACGYVMENGTIPATGYTVSFDANGGIGTMAEVTGVLGDYTLPANGFTAPKCKQFKCWSVGGTEKAVGDKITVTANTTVTAVWENIPATGHKSATTTTKATTKADGKIVKKCLVCNKILSTTVIPKASSVKLSATSYTYNGKVKTPSVTVKDSKGKTLKKNTDYTVSYAKGRKNVGKYAVKITFKGNYSGTKTLYFTIKPKATSISKVTAGSKKFTVKWKKQATQTTGYQIQYSTSSKFSKAKTVTVSKNKTTSKTVSKLKAKKKYYVRVRTYKTVKINGKATKIYSSWSKAKSVTTKK